MYARHDLRHIARLCGCSPATVLNRMDRYGIPRRHGGQAPVVSVTFEQDPGFLRQVNERVEADLARGEVGDSVLAGRVRAAAQARQAGDMQAFRSALADVAAASMALAGVA